MNIDKYVAKKIMVSAVRITSGNIREVADWVNDRNSDAQIETIGAVIDGALGLTITSEDHKTIIACGYGDWVVATDDAYGDFEVWSSEDFDERFEPAP